ncbi:DUF5753 domain-containing protein [Actinomadura sp. WMMB 499]|uniref:DUF5753 domain-containing protein n=1 Tax=Actinomadura sp. WMMB 499 TaxID=1219491 RepID=UPI001248D033|nr:DUF5753 domain-containing protein [Actinomadura sp. WMMB 499]QFG26481.1 hypothetical protein F7P10_40450 [Actinomadura sp. WMMB 499]
MLDEAFALEQFFEALHPRIVEEAGLSPGFAEFTEAEAEAGVIRSYENFLINDLFQTEDYARAVLRGGRPSNEVDRLVAVRAERQEILRQDTPPLVVGLLDSSTLRRPFGGREVMRAQLEHLLTLADLPHVHLHLIPEDAALSPGGAFTLLGSADGADSAYAESAGGSGRLVNDAACVTELDRLLDLIRSKALNAEDSQVAVLKALEEL